MAELLIIACLLKDPTVCESFPVPFMRPITIMQCMFEGQLRMKSWADRHPRWQVRRWKCAAPEA